ncbi:orotate phosphoribosyltransferase, partial [Peribacillus sp. NPDC060186]
VSIFSYELEKGKEKFLAEGITNYSLSDYSTLIKVANEKGYITEGELEKLKKWRENPEDTAWISA